MVLKKLTPKELEEELALFASLDKEGLPFLDDDKEDIDWSKVDKIDKSKI